MEESSPTTPEKGPFQKEQKHIPTIDFQGASC